MKKALKLLAVLACANAFGAFAITWTMDSSPFSFPGVGVALTNQTLTAPTLLRCQQYAKGKVIMHYNLPSADAGAKLSIYNVNGACKASFSLKSASGTVEWSNGANKLATGVYVAVLQSTVGEEKIKFSILQ